LKNRILYQALSQDEKEYMKSDANQRFEQDAVKSASPLNLGVSATGE